MNTEYLTSTEAASYLKISKSTLYKKTSSQAIPFTKPGGKLIMVLKSDLDDYLSKNRFESKETIQNNFLTTLKNDK